jgi:hypothetical protein
MATLAGSGGSQLPLNCSHSVLLFVSPPDAGIRGRPLKTLAGFGRIEQQQRQQYDVTRGSSTREIRFKLTAFDLSVVSVAGVRHAVKGRWNLTVGLPGGQSEGPSATLLVDVTGAAGPGPDHAGVPPSLKSDDGAPPANTTCCVQFPIPGNETKAGCEAVGERLSWWTFSDIFQEHNISRVVREQGLPQTEFSSAYGLQTVSGVRKPGWRAFELAHQSGDKKVESVEISNSSGLESESSPFHAFATMDSSAPGLSSTMVFVSLWGNPYNRAPPHHDTPPHQVTANRTATINIVYDAVTGRSESTPPTTIWATRIDEQHAYPQAAWKAMGSPMKPSAAQLHALHAASELHPQQLPLGTRCRFGPGHNAPNPPGTCVTVTLELAPNMAVLLSFKKPTFGTSTETPAYKSDDVQIGAVITTPWIPPPVGSSDLLPFLRDTSRPKLAYSTWVGWYTSGGLNETVLLAQAEAMASKLRPHGWTHLLHDYGWANNLAGNDVYVDRYGRLYPSYERYPSTAVNCSTDCRPGCSTDCRDHTWGTWKPFVEQVHAKGLAFGVHLIHGIPKIAVTEKLQIYGTNLTADRLVSQPPCKTFIPDMLAINASAPGAQEYYDSVIGQWADQTIDFVYLDGVIQDCAPTAHCWLGEIALIADSMKRLGNGMHLFLSGDKPSGKGCSWDELSELAPYVRVGTDTIDSFGPAFGTPAYTDWLAGVRVGKETFEGSVEGGFSAYTRSIAGSIRPHHFPDMASMLIGKVHKNGGPSGPDYYIPSNESVLTQDEVVSYVSLVAMMRSTWWPAGVLSEMSAFELEMLTNDAVIRVTMMSTRTRQVPDALSRSFDGPGIIWTSDDVENASWKYVLLVNLHANKTMTTAVTFDQLGLLPSASCHVDDLWSGANETQITARVTTELRPRASRLLRLTCSREDQ